MSKSPRARRRNLVVAIDGPAGSGKTTVARGVAKGLGYRRLDTGAMYRAVTLESLRRGVDPGDARALARLAGETAFDMGESGILVNGRPPGRGIRRREVSATVSQVSAHPEVRRVLVRRQRELVGKGGVVAEGRDIGTVVCPGADLKVFLTASPTERARRRHRELEGNGSSVSRSTLEREIRRRDARDSTRAVSPLRPAADAVVIDSTGRSARSVVAEILRLLRPAPARRARPQHKKPRARPADQPPARRSRPPASGRGTRRRPANRG